MLDEQYIEQLLARIAIYERHIQKNCKHNVLRVCKLTGMDCILGTCPETHITAEAPNKL